MNNSSHVSHSLCNSIIFMSHVSSFYSLFWSSLQVYGDKDADGFYRGESGGRHGYVPCNMVSEIQVDDEETKEQLLQQGFLSTEASMEKIGTFHSQTLYRFPTFTSVRTCSTFL